MLLEALFLMSDRGALRFLEIDKFNLRHFGETNSETDTGGETWRRLGKADSEVEDGETLCHSGNSASSNQSSGIMLKSSIPEAHIVLLRMLDNVEGQWVQSDVSPSFLLTRVSKKAYSCYKPVKAPFTLI